MKTVAAASKNKRGFTLVELIVTIGIMVIVVVMSGSAVQFAAESYVLNKRMLDDQYNGRMALLSIAREVHRSTSKATIDITTDANGNSVLKIKTIDDVEVTYSLNDGILERDTDTPIPFVPVNLEKFNVVSDGKWLTFSIDCEYGLHIDTKIAISRVPLP